MAAQFENNHDISYVNLRCLFAPTFKREDAQFRAVLQFRAGKRLSNYVIFFLNLIFMKSYDF